MQIPEVGVFVSVSFSSGCWISWVKGKDGGGGGEWGKVKIRKKKKKGAAKGGKKKMKKKKKKKKKSPIFTTCNLQVYIYFSLLSLLRFFSSTFWQIQLNHRFSLLVCVCALILVCCWGLLYKGNWKKNNNNNNEKTTNFSSEFYRVHCVLSFSFVLLLLILVLVFGKGRGGVSFFF